MASIIIADDHPIMLSGIESGLTGAGHTVVARFRRATGTTADPASRFDLRWPSGQRFIAQPYANHNAGNLALTNHLQDTSFPTSGCGVGWDTLHGRVANARTASVAA